MRKLIPKIILFVLASCFSFTGLHAANAQEGYLFTRLPQAEADVSPLQNVPFSATTHQLVAINPALFSTPLESEFLFAASGTETYTVVHDRKWRHRSGGTTWVGYLKEFGKVYRVFITKAKEGAVVGRLRTPDGAFRLRQGTDGVWLIDEELLNLTPAPLGEDGIPVPVGNSMVDGASPFYAAAEPAVVAEGAGEQSTTIDVMVLYSPGLAAAYPGSALSARLDQLAALANQAYLDSGINQTVRLVHSEEIAYSETESNSNALTALKNGTGAFAGVAALRDTYGADLVTFIRPFYQPTHGGCGLGYVISDYGLDAWGFSVVGDGEYQVDLTTYYCTEYTFAHELGHNMGSAHERAQYDATEIANIVGFYNYSYGYGVNGQFGTIMSYINPEVGYFSNPYVSLCAGFPCGIDENDPDDAANNALSLNNTRSIISAFKPTVVPFAQPVNLTPILPLLLGQ